MHFLMILKIQSVLDSFKFKNLWRTTQFLVGKFLIYAYVHWKISCVHWSVWWGGQMLQTFEEHEKVWEMLWSSSNNFWTMLNLAQHKFIIKKGGQMWQTFAGHESWTLFVELFITFGQGFVIIIEWLLVYQWISRLCMNPLTV